MKLYEARLSGLQPEFQKGVTGMCIYHNAGVGGPGAMLSQEQVLILDALRLLLRPFWDRSSPAVTYIPHRVCIIFLDAILCMLYAFTKPVDIAFQKRSTTVG